MRMETSLTRRDTQLNKLCKKYISSVKSLFPILGREERKYIKNLKSEIENFIEDNEITAMEELFQKYGSPNEIISNYYSEMSLDNMLKKINKKRLLKIIVTVFIIILLIVLITYFVTIFVQSQVRINNSRFFPADY